MSVADKLGLGPTREHRRLSGDRYEVKVTPPAIFGFSPSTIILSADQFGRYEIWLSKGGFIQDCLPELSADQREILISGIGPKEWDKKVAGEPCPTCAGTGGLYGSYGGKVLDEPCNTCGGTGRAR